MMDDKALFSAVAKKTQLSNRRGGKKYMGLRRGVKPDVEGYFLCARVNKRAERGQIYILKGKDLKEARNCKPQ